MGGGGGGGEWGANGCHGGGITAGGVGARGLSEFTCCQDVADAREELRGFRMCWGRGWRWVWGMHGGEAAVGWGSYSGCFEARAGLDLEVTCYVCWVGQPYPVGADHGAVLEGGLRGGEVGTCDNMRSGIMRKKRKGEREGGREGWCDNRKEA